MNAIEVEENTIKDIEIEIKDKDEDNEFPNELKDERNNINDPVDDTDVLVQTLMDCVGSYISYLLESKNQPEIENFINCQSTYFKNMPENVKQGYEQYMKIKNEEMQRQEEELQRRMDERLKKYEEETIYYFYILHFNKLKIIYIRFEIYIIFYISKKGKKKTR